MATRISITTTYYEAFLVLSVSVRVGRHQLKMETPGKNQTPILRYRDVTFTSEYLKDSLSAVCSVMGVHNVARVRQGLTVLFEVDFSEEKSLEKFCKSMSNGTIQRRLKDKLKEKKDREVNLMLKLYLILPNAEKKSPVSREVTVDNYQECVSLMRDSALFDFESLNIAHDALLEEKTPEVFNIDDLGELLQDLSEMAAFWFTVGLLLKISYSKLLVIQNDNRDQCMDCMREMLATWLMGTEALPSLLVHALRLAGMSVLAKKMAVKHGVTFADTTKSITKSRRIEPEVTAAFIGDLSQFIISQSTASALPVALTQHMSALKDHRERIFGEDKHCSHLNEQLSGLKDKEEEVTKSVQETKSTLESVKNQIDNLIYEQDTLIKKREMKRSSKLWLMEQKSSTSGQDLVNRMIEDVEETVAELSRQIDELEEKIKAQNRHADQIIAQLVLEEDEKKQLEIEMDKIQKEKLELERELERDRKCFERELQKIMHELQINETKVELMKDELTHKRQLNILQAKMLPLAKPMPQAGPEFACPYKTITSSEMFIKQQLERGDNRTVYYAAIYKPRNGNYEVNCALKCWKPTEEMSKLNFEIHREANIMTKLDHPNIVKLFGMRTGNAIAAQDRFVVLTYASHKLQLNKPCVIVGNPNQLVMELASLGSLNTFLRRHPNFHSDKIVNFMLQVAKGMEYLEKARIVHCDLAAYNVLVMDEENVKISGFGLSREIEEGSEYYKTENPDPCPIKWCAPESIFYSRFNSKSDVWSYGITMWEAFSYGAQPYQGVRVDEVIPMLENNERLQCPERCPLTVYDLMMKTWSWRPEDRPSFVNLVEVLPNLTSVSPYELFIDEEEWYFGNIDREEAEIKCLNQGDYLVRRNTHRNRYVLSVNWNGAGRHFLIQEVYDPTSGCSLYHFEDKGFSTTCIYNLLDYHVKSQIAVTRRSGVILSKAVSRSKWTILRCNIQLGQKIGCGSVFEGKIISSKRQVAVKTCQSHEERHKMLQEAEILKQCKHSNIVQLIGVVDESKAFYIIMEFMPGGSFLDFLRQRGRSCLKKKLMFMCTQLCAGMMYLEKNNCIHRDVAARSCLVGENDITKISGFDMSFKQENETYTLSSESRRTPIKWTAPEALNYDKYTSASDVWSFGILLWETFSFGSVPYPGMKNFEAREQVKSGYRMPPPADCPEPVYNVMLKCWQYNEEERPTFAELHPMLNHVCQMIYD